MPELPGGRCEKGDTNLSLQFWAEKGYRDGGRAMLCELLLLPAPAVQASHKPSCTPGLLKQGKSGLCSQHLRVSCAPNSCNTECWDLPPSQHSPSSCIAQGGRFSKWNCSPQLGCPAEAAAVANIPEKTGQTPARTWSPLGRDKDKK